MKSINNIYEASILADIDDQLTNGDNALKKHQKEKLIQLFDLKHSKGIGFVFSPHVKDVAVKKKLFIEQCCSVDSDNTLTIDFTKVTSDKALSSFKDYLPSITIYNTVNDIDKIKIIDYPDGRRDNNTLLIVTAEFDLTKIDKTSIIQNIEFKKITGQFLLNDNTIPFNVNSCIKYTNINGFKKIHKNKWPKCKLEFNKTSWMNIINSEVFGNKDIELGYTVQRLTVK